MLLMEKFTFNNKTIERFVFLNLKKSKIILINNLFNIHMTYSLKINAIENVFYNTAGNGLKYSFRIKINTVLLQTENCLLISQKFRFHNNLFYFSNKLFHNINK